MMKPRVSVMMPVYCTAKFVGEAIESILNQTVREFELIVIDDGSTDRSSEIIREYAIRDSRIRWCARENRGIVATRNELWTAAKGPLLAPMDSDDIAHPQRLERCIAYMDEHPDVLCLGTGWRLVDVHGRPYREVRGALTCSQVDELLVSGVSPFSQSSAMFRHAAVEAVGGYRDEARLCEDLDLWMRLAEKGPVVRLAEVLVSNRIRHDSDSGKHPSSQIEAARRACLRCWSRRGVSGVFAAAGGWRPESDRESQYRHLVEVGWGGWKFGSREMAIEYALRAAKCYPFDGAWLRLLLVAFMRGHRG